ncbi:MAG: phenylalanine--tRNA ligase subunit alpha [Candidatus Aenigmarchaeota archaeon]|nr:phenylalanine--tRNA ligase subunit alpha [Candidatus Aenigmarchaeota archaeon]
MEYRLTPEGEEYLRNGLPEQRLVELLKQGPLTIQQASEQIPNFSIALQWAKKNRWVVVTSGVIELTEHGDEETADKTRLDHALHTIAKGNSVASDIEKILLSRKLIEEIKKTFSFTESEIAQLSPEIIRSEVWKTIPFRTYDVHAPAPKVCPGRRHPVMQAVEYARKVWTEMGFKEMEGPLIQLSFWNFDALFTAQDHPVREMQDTLFTSPEKGTLPDATLVKNVKKAHEEGTRDSLGWGGTWDPEVAKKYALRTHTTCLSLKTIAQIKKDGFPAKYFAVGRCFRNEATDWKHGFEFNQTEGIVVDENVNFRHLLGYLKEFFKRMGFAQARFRPSFYPYTEMSVGIEVFHPSHKKWVELGGAGIFRPEVVEPLLGKFVPVLAWGPGFDRLITDYYKIERLPELYANDIKTLREVKQWMM